MMQRIDNNARATICGGSPLYRRDTGLFVFFPASLGLLREQRAHMRQVLQNWAEQSPLRRKRPPLQCSDGHLHIEPTDSEYHGKADSWQMQVNTGLQDQKELLGRLPLDELSMGPEPMVVESIFEALAELNRQGMTILMVEQSAEMALSLAHRAVVLQTGRVVAAGLAEELRKDDRVRSRHFGV
ncbi:MAG: hypothetical protein N3B14_00475 [Thermoleophilia bacterium]|nr:hypothetical protein [Thermoleophilia bacterium]